MTDLEIANFALDRLGARNITSFADATHPHAALIGRFIAAYREEILRMVAWPAALKDALLVSVDDTTMAWAALTAYTVGAHRVNSGNLYRCITAGTSAAATGPTTAAADITDGSVHWQFIRVLGDNLTGYAYRYPAPADCLRIKSVGDGQDYKLLNGIIYSDLDEPRIVYVYPLDYDLFDPIMTDALMLRLAAAIAKSVTGEARQDLFQEFSAVIGMALTAAKSEATERPQNSGLWTENDA
jgi:hypothetical protein